MSNASTPDGSVFANLHNQELQSRKRPCCTHSSVSGSQLGSPVVSPVKKVKRQNPQLTPTNKRSTPIKKSPEPKLAQVCLSDFSDWDDSPTKEEGKRCELVRVASEKENSELNDSFDEPVFTNSPRKPSPSLNSANNSCKKRSVAIRLCDEGKTSPIKELQTNGPSGKLDSGVAGFPSLCDPKTEIILTVREIKKENGLVDLICSTETGEDSVVYLEDQWAELTFEPDTQIHLIGAQRWGESDWLVSNEHGVLVVAPDFLVPCTSIASSTWCSRKVVLSDRFRCSVRANKAMVIGTVMHELFQGALRSPDPRLVTRKWLLDRWRSSLSDDVLSQLVALHCTTSDFEDELAPYADVVADWIQTHLPGGSSYCLDSSSSSLKVHDIEENIWVSQLGVKGKVDVTLKETTTIRTHLRPLELKTGKSGQSIEHAAQVMLYSLMLSSRYKQPIGGGILLYLKDGISREIQPKALELKAIVNQRNNLAFYLSKLDPLKLPAPRADPKFCDRCDQASICSFYQIAMEPAEKSSDLMYDFAKANMSHLKENHLKYFAKWIRWIFSEWSEDQSRKGSSVENLWRKSPAERESDGFCAACLRLVSCEDISKEIYSSYLLTFESEVEISTMFSPGSMCTVSTTVNPALLLVPIVDSSSFSITVRSDRMIDKEEIYHLDLYHSFSTCSTTLGSLILIMGSDQASTRKRELIVDLMPPGGSNATNLPSSVHKILSDGVALNQLNEEQREAVLSALICNDYTLIEGFPGSGKTTTIVALLRCLLELKLSVLLTANTHSALDNVLTKLRKYVDASKMLRLGRSTSTSNSVADLTFQAKMSVVDGDKYEAAKDLLENTPLLASTCHYVPRELLFSYRTFDYCIVDEASMVLEPVVLPAIATARRFVLVGDSLQLAPLVQNRKCAEEGMAVSLFERLQVHDEVTHSLVSQYRMNSVISRLSSHLFYADRLVCGNNSVANACLSDSRNYKVSAVREGSWKLIESGSLEYSTVFVDTKAVTESCFAMTNDGAGMVHNSGEAKLVHDVVARFLENGVAASDIGIMCVYRKQVNVIKSFLDPEVTVEVSSVDQYQGRDKSVIIWSLVWTNTSGRRCELLQDRRRVNVALTRAKHKLVLVGCAQSMRSIDVMKKVVESMVVVEL
ncbi:hypothetical protein RB195_000107 [Necator americanus]